MQIVKHGTATLGCSTHPMCAQLTVHVLLPIHVNARVDSTVPIANHGTVTMLFQLVLVSVPVLVLVTLQSNVFASLAILETTANTLLATESIPLQQIHQHVLVTVHVGHLRNVHARVDIMV